MWMISNSLFIFHFNPQWKQVAALGNSINSTKVRVEVPIL